MMPSAAKHIKLKTGPDYRMVVISDIHAHATVFNDLLEKVNLKDGDHLVILGDFINRGPENMDALKLMMTLAKRPRTYIMKGNHEAFVLSYVHSKEEFREMLDFLKSDPYELILHDMAKVLNIDLYNCQDAEMLRQALIENFKAEFEFMESRPVLLENESFRLVHGGFQKEFCPEKDEGKLLKYDFYNEKSSIQDKPVIVGHWPAGNLRTDVMTNLPFFNDEKKIITIDGGLGVKSSGELNAFIITAVEGTVSFDVIQSNTYEEGTIIKTNERPQEELIIVDYPHFDIEVLREGHQFTECRHLHSGKVFSVFNSLLSKDDEKTTIDTSYINRFFNLAIGERVEICKAYDDCVLVKHKHEFGWVLREQVEVV